MKEKFLFVFCAFVLAAILALRFPAKVISEKKQKSIKLISCSRDWNQINQLIVENEIPPIPGAGIYKWKISTTSDSAQFYFNQGINMYYSFHIIEAMASFNKALKFDSRSAMLYWAKALTYGPNINDFGYAASYNAFLAAGRAIESCGNCTEKEIRLIRAQRSRYTGDSTENRKELNQVYVDQMKEVYDEFPNDPDVSALYADAMMLQHPWDLWNKDGTTKTWTPLIRTVLEKALAKSPDHPGANHYYIHVMEPSPYAYKALPSAERLGKTNPGLSHVVHMPSHIYLRTGFYQKGIDVNIKAVNSYQKSISLYAPVTGADFLYLIHNLHMKTNNAMLAGNFKISEEAAFETRNSIPNDYLLSPAPMGSYSQYLYMSPTFAYIRFGKWKELLQQTEPDQKNIYASLLFYFGRGMARANEDRVAEAKEDLQELQFLLTDSSLTIPLTPFSPAIDGAIVAENILSGTIALKEKRTDDAIAAFSKAVTTEENMVYNEPRDWLLNPKHYLGNAYLIKKDGINAEKIFRRDLLNNADNGWAFCGLHKALLLQMKLAEAAKVLVKFKVAFNKADVKITSPVY
jgi:hypothetical protein